MLLVEDDASVRASAARMLCKLGYNVLEASSGNDAVRIAGEHVGGIHLVLTDVVMPGMSGCKLVSQLEAVRQGIKALYTSGYTDDVIVHHGILDLDVAFIQKPFSLDALAQKVREAIDL